MRYVITPAIAIFFLLICSSGPVSIATIHDQFDWAVKSRNFHDAVMILACILFALALLAVIFWQLRRNPRNQEK